MMTRRGFSCSLLAAAVMQAKLPPVRAITRGPKFHWFGYYDKLQFDPSSRYALGVEGSFEHRLPTAEDTLRIGMVDTGDGDRWTDLGITHAWSWHQTCMLQWLPGSRSEIIYNDRQDGRLVSHILDVKSGKRRTLPAPIYCLSPDAGMALFTDFRRLYDVRPETGYAGVPDPNRNVLAPADAGVWKMDLRTGKHSLLLSYADIVKIPSRGVDWSGAKHWFNHLLISPDGKRFAFLHRWRGKAEGKGFSTRMFTADLDGRNLRLWEANNRFSHYIWRNGDTIVMWCWQPSLKEKFYSFHLPSGKIEPFFPEELRHNGHCSFLPGDRWFLSDTSPDSKRLQHPFLFDTQNRKSYPLGDFYAAPEYTGYWRCDTTPRFSPDGKKVIIDSPHGGNGRQMYLFDVSGIVA
ncbi:MAG TPA: hypothetical protein VL285_01210 [Bryobacteraceae bacterium]|jgi:hypothetical protein|nr:hypothetical protein [Bryobacteraceae bacterium]